jgi:hypothetical protein
MTTPRLGAPELATSQANKEETVNEQIRYVESGAGHFIFKDRDLATSPGSPADGDCYLVAASPTGDWTGHAGDIAFYMNTEWKFIEVIEGFTAWVNDENVFVGYDGSAWVSLSGNPIEVLDEGVSETTSLTSLDFVGSNVSAVDDGSGNVTVTISGGGGGGLYDADWFDVTAYGATGDGSTDDTVAIQAAIDACETAGGGTVYFPRGTYVVNGALQDTSRSNSQLLLPLRDYPDTEAITIVFRGEAPPSAVVSVIGSTPVANNLATIKGTLNTGSGGALIGGQGPSGTFQLFTNILFVIRDLSFQMPANPVLSALNLSKVAQVDIDNVIVHTGDFDVSNLSMETTSSSYGLRTPATNNGAMTRLGNVNVVGYYNGFEIGEHCVGQNVSAWGCKRGYVFPAAVHASYFARMQTLHCQTGLIFTASEHDTYIAQLNIEHAASGTWVTTADIDDASNYARGAVNWHIVTAGFGIDGSILTSGAKYFKRERLQRLGAVLALTDGATVTVDCDQGGSYRWTIGGNRTFANPTNPYDGQVINVRIIQDGTGSRTWTLGSKFKFAGGSPVLSTAANAKDFLSCQYDATDDTWNCALSKAMS